MTEQITRATPKKQHLQAEKSLKKRIYTADTQQQGSTKPGQLGRASVAGGIPSIWALQEAQQSEKETKSTSSLLTQQLQLCPGSLCLLSPFSMVVLTFPSFPGQELVPAPSQGRLHLVLAKPLGKSFVNQKPHLAQATP